MKLRSHLFILALGTIVPVAIFAIVVAVWLVERERDALREGAERRTFALLTAVDAQLRGHLTTAEALASVPSLQDGNLVYFHDVAENALKSQPQWLNFRLMALDGTTLIDLRFADHSGAAPGSTAANASFSKAAHSGKSAVSDLTWDSQLQQWRFSIYVPVLSKGTIRYVLAADIKPESIASILQAQRLEEGWISVVLDASNCFVARTGGSKYVGQPASASLQGALAASSHGWFRGKTVEGLDVYSPFHRSETTGWTVSMGIPASVFDSAAWRSGGTLLLGMALSIVLALIGAHLINRRIAKPITSLAGATEAMTKGAATEIPVDSRVDEIRTLARALHESASAAHERQMLIEREKSALQEADRAKDRFLAMLSHELRNPLAAITAANHVLKMGKPGSAATIKAQLVIERQTRHMAHLIGDLLDISRVTLGKMAIARESLELADAVRKLLGIWRQSGRLQRHPLRTDLEEVWVHADRSRVEQIVANLLDNALKFTPGGKGIRVAVRAEGGEAVIQVADEGAGIPAHLEGRLFEPFVQGNEPGTLASAGLGVGLALVKGLAEMHGGSVSAANDEASGGAVFTVRLPAIKAPVLEPGRRDGSPRGRHILLIEDDDDTRTMLHAALEFGGHEVREARDGTTGLALAAEAPPDVAVIDIGLPDIDGLEVARRLRSSQGKRRLALVALTGFGGPDDQRRALDAGFDVHLTKPVTQERLKRVIGEFK